MEREKNYTPMKATLLSTGGGVHIGSRSDMVSDLVGSTSQVVYLGGIGIYLQVLSLLTLSTFSNSYRSSYPTSYRLVSIPTGYRLVRT